MKNEKVNEPQTSEVNRTATEIPNVTPDEVSEIFGEVSSDEQFLAETDGFEAAASDDDVVSMVEDSEKKTYEKRPIDALASEFAIDMYHYCASIREKGHATLADMMFRDTMEVNLSANMASSAIGRDKFIGCLESAYYASGRVIEFLKFAALCNASDYNQTELLDKADRIHRIYAVSIKTATGKSRKKDKVYM